MLTKIKPDDVRESDRTRQIAACLADAIIALRALPQPSRPSLETFSETPECSLDSSANPWLCVTTPNVSASETPNRGVPHEA